MVLPIKSALSSFISYEEPIFIQWLSHYEATDRVLEKSKIEFLRPDHQMLRRVLESQERVLRVKNRDEYDIEYPVFLSHLRTFVAQNFLPKGVEEGIGNHLWIQSGVIMATELAHARMSLELNEWPRKSADKDRWRALVFGFAKNAIDDVLEPIYDALFFGKHEMGVAKIDLDNVFQRKLEVHIDLPIQLAMDTIYPFIEKYPSDDEILKVFNSLLNSKDEIRKYLAKCIDEQLTLSSMSSVKALKGSLAKGRKILYS